MTKTNEQPYIELNGTAIMMKIKADLERFDPEDKPLYIWIGSKAYRRVLSASTDRNWPFETKFDKEGNRIFGIRFIIDDECGDNAICYAP